MCQPSIQRFLILKRATNSQIRRLHNPFTTIKELLDHYQPVREVIRLNPNQIPSQVPNPLIYTQNSQTLIITQTLPLPIRQQILNPKRLILIKKQTHLGQNHLHQLRGVGIWEGTI